MIKIGTKVKFDPLEGIKFYGCMERGVSEVIGTVVDINEAHQWFSVEYTPNGKDKLRKGFKFADIGDNVEII